MPKKLTDNLLTTVAKSVGSAIGTLAHTVGVNGNAREEASEKPPGHSSSKHSSSEKSSSQQSPSERFSSEQSSANTEQRRDPQQRSQKTQAASGSLPRSAQASASGLEHATAQNPPPKSYVKKKAAHKRKLKKHTAG